VKQNISFAATGCQKLTAVDSERRLCTVCEKFVAVEVAADAPEISRKTSTFALLTMPKPLTVWITTNWKILREIGIPDHLTCLLKNLYADQEAS
uniref:Uncharacterized protein n=1 Tax=Moschus moschiferus TaxID=68415 RepID=A0A8C6FRN2_MOSMO